ncbi:MAG: ferrochelatase [Alphaproteobacteria bacterium]|nr:ferrochelatase [Alphaproteobacteria bacterium]
MRTAVILFNLGGPDGPDAVRPFLQNLFSDPAIITLPWILRTPIARLIAKRRAPVAQEIYGHIGGRSPIVPQTQAQARALEAALGMQGLEAKAFIAMRYWHPFSDGAAMAVKAYAPDRIVLLPLYPQFSTTTTESSVRDWQRAARKAGLNVPTAEICCYPRQAGFVAAMASRIRDALGDAPPAEFRLLLSAHGLPKKIIRSGDPYQWQVEQSAAAIVDALGIPDLDWQVCYQSRVGPLEWIGPSTDDEIRRAGADGRKVIVAPLAFVSEHSETLVELDIEYARLARESGVADYRRAGTVTDHPDFIAGLAGLVRDAVLDGARSPRLCPTSLARCGCAGEKA